MWVKMFFMLIIAFILMSLGFGLFYLVRRGDDRQRLATALSWRIGLSVLLFILLFVAFALGWIKPHGI